MIHQCDIIANDGLLLRESIDCFVGFGQTSPVSRNFAPDDGFHNNLYVYLVHV